MKVVTVRRADVQCLVSDGKTVILKYLYCPIFFSYTIAVGTKHMHDMNH